MKFPFFQSSDIPDVDMSTLVPTEVSTPNSVVSSQSSTSVSLASSTSGLVTTSAGVVPTSGLVNNPVIKTEIEDVDMQEIAGSNLDEGQQQLDYRFESQPQEQLNLTTVKGDQTTGGQAKMTLGQMALAGIVISSGPGDHFETYEGMKIFRIY